MTINRSHCEVIFLHLCGENRQRGFTLIELIMVIVMLGVLAVFAAPRIFNSNDFYARGFYDETLAFLRYAQKTAIAQRRTVCVAFNVNSVTLTIAPAAPTPASPTPTCGAAPLPLRGPKGESPATITAKSDVVFIALPAAFNFDGLGQPIRADGTGASQVTQIIQVSNAANTITVEAVTGYVHE